MTDLGDFIRMQRQLSHMSLRQLAELSDVSNAYLSQLERGLYRPSAQVLKSLANALELSAEELYRRAGLLDEDGNSAPLPSVEQAIRLDENLSPEQKEALIAVYRGLTN
jgi:transcriptional regulator with XRE-family HTH domain